MPLRETGHGDRVSILVVVAVPVVVFALAALLVDASPRHPRRTALWRAAGVLACALALQAASLQLVLQASTGFDSGWGSRLPGALRVRARRTVRQPAGREPAPRLFSRGGRSVSTHTPELAPLLRLGPTRSLTRRASLIRCAVAAAVAAFGIVQVLAVENGAAGTLVGAALVALAAPLARGRRRALLAATGFVLASLALDDDVVALPGLAAAILLLALLASAPAFRVAGDPATRRLIVPASALLAVGLLADLARAGGQNRTSARRHAPGWRGHARLACAAPVEGGRSR